MEHSEQAVLCIEERQSTTDFALFFMAFIIPSFRNYYGNNLKQANQLFENFQLVAKGYNPAED